ncbi:baseplate multidomain protein megatron [Halocynthiibacter namhaensis]|uniref:baseplate multidomain protein megatron n=1 Tax=Halocynthiibacter namhaensis TaxID=1290553 RepID=UPI00057956CD|nr:glycoside hydrolase/phage tail family protein [Halocynthiibacter namhaensis]
MATIVLGAAGAALGSAFGGTVLGLSSAVIGRAIGATIGRAIDARIMGGGAEPVETGKVDRFRLMSASEGSAIPHLYGAMRVAGQVIWASDFLETSSTSQSGGGGKGGAPKGPKVTSYEYSVSMALAVSEGEISGIGRIWADGDEISAEGLNMRVYTGRGDQMPDLKIEAVEGTGNAPAYRGIAYVVLEDLPLAQFGNRIPQLSFEVERPERGIEGDVISQAQTLAEGVQGIALIPGTGEYSLATTPVHYSDGPGQLRGANVNSPTGLTDLESSVGALGSALPVCKSTSLVVSWFGDDLRMGHCKLRPKVEQNTNDAAAMPWAVSGVRRNTAELIPREDDRTVYGGTPTDQSVIEAIRHLSSAGRDVVVYPFILMDQLSDNGLIDPWSDATDQPRLPWRGRITGNKAPGQVGSTDTQVGADAEVVAFFGTASATDFVEATVSASPPAAHGASVGQNNAATVTTVINYTGPEEWSYRRFILHYAHICAAAGGVDAFCIGSEMRGMTQYRGANDTFPAVEALIALAADVRSILGPDVKIGYAADWSEYFGYHPQDGSGDVYFHLDALWMDTNIDFIGVDNYMPLSDWREGTEHLDAHWGSIYNPDYLRGNVAGGEGYDWFYHSPEARAAQIRTPITDGAENEPWVFRYKDIHSWWTKLHYNRRNGGLRDADPNEWVPGSKPFWFMEYGCAAIDKGANEPNKFLDPKSSESGLPHYSDGSRDELMQRAALGAVQSYWADPVNNPVDALSGYQMVDMSRAHVWAWDARPFPWFPNNGTLWSDGVNYPRGHWLNGRASGWTLAGVVAEICQRSGVDKFDVSDLHGYVRGYLDDGGRDARAALQPLMLAYGFDAIEREGVVTFQLRDGRPTTEIPTGDLAVTEEQDVRVQTTRSAAAEIAGRIRLNHVEAGGNYDTVSTEAIFPDEVTYSISQNELPLAMTQNEARAVAERWLAEARVARDTVRIALPPSRLPIGAGDVVHLPDEEGRNAMYRIDHVEQSGFQLVDAIRVEPGVYVPGDSSLDVPKLRPFMAPVPVLPVFMDLPLIFGNDEAHAPWLAVAAKPWPGTVAAMSSPSDSGYEVNRLFPSSATFGTTLSDLQKAPSGVKDRTAFLTVKLSTGTLSSADWPAVLNGANLAAIGDGSADGWELFQFEEAVLVAPNTWELRGFLRGQKGSDGIIANDWPVGSLFVLMDNAPLQIERGIEARGLDRHYRVGPAGRPVDDPSYIHVIGNFKGNGLRPYSPAHLKAMPDGADMNVTWVRRTRVDGDSWEGFEVPLGEESEMYLVKIWDDGILLREETVTVQSFTYTNAMQVSDAAVAPYTIEVTQISALYGAGAPARFRVE